MHAELRTDILEARIQPGELILEPELATRFGVSKTPVREALQLLVFEGLVLLIPRRGYVVRPFGFAEVREMLDLRLMLEPPMARSATAHRTAQAIASLEDLYDAQINGGATSELTSAARSFHQVLLEPARNSRAQAILSTLFDETTRLHFLMPEMSQHIHSSEESVAHRRILDAFAAGDGKSVEEAMREHLEEVRDTVLQAFLDY